MKKSTHLNTPNKIFALDGPDDVAEFAKFVTEYPGKGLILTYAESGICKIVHAYILDDIKTVKKSKKK